MDAETQGVDAAIINCVIHRQGKISINNISKGLVTLLGVEPAEMQAEPIKLLRVVAKRHRRELLSKLKRAFNNKGEFSCRVECKERCTSCRWLQVIVTPFGEKPKGHSFQITLLDVSKQVVMERDYEMLTLFSEASTNGIVVTDPEGYTTWINKSFERICGYSLEELFGKKPGHVLQGKDTDQTTANYLRKKIHQGEEVYCELLNYHKDGEPYWIELYVTPIRNDKNNITKFIAIENDVTRRKTAELNLKAVNHTIKATLRELEYQKFALDEHAIVAITNVKGDITYVNEKFCAISGYSETELLGQNHRMLNSGYHSEAFFKEMYAAIAQGKTWKGAIRNKRKNGQYYWVQTTIVPFLDERTQKPKRYVAIRADITKTKEYEEGLVDINKTYEQVLQATKDVIWVWDVQEDVLDISLSFSKIIARPMELTNGIQGLFQFMPKEDLGRVKHSLKHAIQNPKAQKWKDEYRILTGDGRVVNITNKALITRNTIGKAIKVVGALRDVTERVRHIQRLEQQNEQLKAIAWTQSHEMRAPLANVMGLIPLLESAPYGSEEYNSILQKLKTTSGRIDQVVHKVVKITESIEEGVYRI